MPDKRTFLESLEDLPKVVAVLFVLFAAAFLWAAFLPAWQQRHDKLHTRVVWRDMEAIAHAFEEFRESNGTNPFPHDIHALYSHLPAGFVSSSNEWNQLLERYYYIKPNVPADQALGTQLIVLIERTNSYTHYKEGCALRAHGVSSWESNEDLDTLRAEMRSFADQRPQDKQDQ